MVLVAINFLARITAKKVFLKTRRTLLKYTHVNIAGIDLLIFNRSEIAKDRRYQNLKIDRNLQLKAI